MKLRGLCTFGAMSMLSGFAACLLHVALSSQFSAKPGSAPRSQTGRESGKAGLEFGARVGGLYGEPVEQEEWFYAYTGTRIKDENGIWQPLVPAVRGVGIELNAWLRHSPVVQVGLGFEMEWYRIHPQDYNSDAFFRDFLEQKNVLLKIRVLPFEYSRIRFGIEGGAGMAFGSMRRYALALINRPDSLIRPAGRQYTEFVANANRPLDLFGTRMGFGPVLYIPIFDRLGLVAKGDFHWTMWNIDQTDPLERYRAPAYPEYPKGLVAQGADFALLLSATF